MIDFLSSFIILSSFSIHSFVHSFIHIFVRSSIHPSIHSFIHSFLPLQVEAQLSSEEFGRDLGGVQNLLKKQQLLERDIKAREDRLKELEDQAKKFVQEQHFDADSIDEKQKNIDNRYDRYVCNKLRLHGNDK